MVEAVFGTATKGAAEYSAKLLDIAKNNTVMRVLTSLNDDRREVCCRR